MLILKKFEKLISGLESQSASFFYSLITFVSAITLRNFLEIFSDPALVSFSLISAKSVDYTIAGYSIAVGFSHYFMFWLTLFLTYAIVLGFILKENPLKILKVFFSFSLILIITPLADLIISKGAGFSIQYAYPKKIFDLLPFPNVATPGMMLTICLGMAGIFLFCFIKTKNFLKSLLATGAAYLIGLGLGSLPAIINARHPLIILRFLTITSVIEIICIFYLTQKSYATALFNDIRWPRIGHYWLMFIFGILLAKPHLFLSIKNEPHSFLLILLSITFAWIASAIFNNIFDLEIDRISNPQRPLVKNLIPVDIYAKLGYFISFAALFIALTVNITTFFLILLCLTNSFLYSCPPLRLKIVPLFSKIFLALDSLILIILGFLFTGKEISNFPQELSWFFILIATVVFNFIDLKDYSGDKLAGIRTLPAIIGLKKTKILCGIAFIITYAGAGFLLLNLRLAICGAIFGAVQYLYINKRVYQEKLILLTHLAAIGLLLFYLNFL